MKSKKEHTCDCCGNPEVAEMLLNLKTIPPVLCEGIVQIANAKGDYRLGHLKERADRLNNIQTSEQRIAELVEKARKQLGHTSSV